MHLNLHKDPSFVVVRTAHQLRTKMAAGMRRTGLSLTPEEATILVVLAERDEPDRMGSLAALLMRDATTLKRQVDGMVRDGLIERSAELRDRRAVLIGLTDVGRRVSREVIPVLHKVREEMLHGIDVESIESLVKTLLDMQSNMMHSEATPNDVAPDRGDDSDAVEGE